MTDKLVNGSGLFGSRCLKVKSLPKYRFFLFTNVLHCVCFVQFLRLFRHETEGRTIFPEKVTQNKILAHLGLA